nr:hypothetical protein [Tanacetum cinerariifolium]
MGFSLDGRIAVRFYLGFYGLDLQKRVETSDDTVMDDESNQGRMIAKMDQDDVVVLEDDKEEDSEDKGKGNLVEEPKPLKKKQQIVQDEQYARKLHAELNKDID